MEILIFHATSTPRKLHLEFFMIYRILITIENNTHLIKIIYDEGVFKFFIFVKIVYWIIHGKNVCGNEMNRESV